MNFVPYNVVPSLVSRASLARILGQFLFLDATRGVLEKVAYCDIFGNFQNFGIFLVDES